MQKAEQEFLKELDKKLWSAADKLSNNLDAAVYKHVVLGLIFWKYVCDAFEGCVYDPAMGSGGFFVQCEEFIEQYGGKIGQISMYGQESNPTTWRLAAMNITFRGIVFDFGKQPADSLPKTSTRPPRRLHDG